MLPSTLARGAAGNLAARVALVALGLGILLVVARIGPEVQGAFALFVACESMLLTLLSGLGLALAREVSHRRTDAAGALTAALLAAGALGAVAALVLLGLSAWTAREPYQHLWLLAWAAPFLLMVPTSSGLWMGQGRMLPLNLAQVAAPAAVLLLLGLAWWIWGPLTAGMPGVVTLVLAAWVIAKSGVGLATAGWAFHDAGRQAPNWALLQRDARFVLVIGLTNVVSLLNYRASLFLVEHFQGLKEVGVYSVAVQVGEQLWLLSQAVIASVYHRIGDPNRAAAAAMTVRAVRVNVLAAALAAPLLWLVAWLALPAVLGPAYRDVHGPLAALLPGMVAYAAASSLSAFFTNHLGRPHWSAAIAALSLGLNMLGSFWAVPRYGAMGAAVSTSLAYVLAIAAACVLFQRLSGQGWAVWRANGHGGSGDNRASPVHNASHLDV